MFVVTKKTQFFGKYYNKVKDKHVLSQERATVRKEKKSNSFFQKLDGQKFPVQFCIWVQLCITNVYLEFKWSTET